jgi:hypothetical protein
MAPAGVRRQPRHPRFAQLQQPVRGGDLRTERRCRTAQRLIQAVVAVSEDRRLTDFDRRTGARPDGQGFNQIEQDGPTGIETVSDEVAQILYTLR